MAVDGWVPVLLHSKAACVAFIPLHERPVLERLDGRGARLEEQYVREPEGEVDATVDAVELAAI